MGSSDDEGEIVSDSVTDYEFLNAKSDLVSFAKKLPVQWDKEKADCGESSQIFLSGKIDNGLRNIYCEVVAWNFDLSIKKQKPQISVFSINGNWLKLQKPRSRYRELVRTIQISVNFLHLCKWTPQGSERAFWDHLSKVFSMFEKVPSEDDLRGHLTLFTEAVKRDATLLNCKVLTKILDGRPGIRKAVNEDTRLPFIVDDADEVEYEIKSPQMDEPDISDPDENESGADEDDCYDPMCSICDNGGNILMCDGKCLRSFHPTKADGRDSYCETLGFSMEELNDLNSVKWYCKNCEYKRHQCFACGRLGSSDESSGAEVFCCVNGACGYFYHPLCVAKLLHPGNDTVAKELAQRIALGEQFACPAHRCHVCKELEVRKEFDLQFAVCRRCPKSYHRKCLPRKITFEDPTGQVLQRAWENLLSNRILIYCLEHEIDPDIETPGRDHIKFPGPQQKKYQKLQTTPSNKEDTLKRRALVTEASTKRTNLLTQPVKADKQFYSKQDNVSGKRDMSFSAQGSSRKQKFEKNENFLETKDYSGSDGRTLGGKLYDTFFSIDPEEKMPGWLKSAKSESEATNKVNHTTKNSDDCDALNIDGKRRILALIKETSSSITLEQVKQRHRAPSTHSQSQSSEKFVSLGKVEKTIEALYAALKILNGGGRIQDAKSFCGDDLLVQVYRWREKLKVYLAPFLYGMRYTSFGRHFTKINKLKQIVDILHWYIQDGDMLVDFCCGSNDFSCLMKAKLDEMKKKTFFKNYDILQPKNDFNFERRDWISVQKHELPEGSQLIMGLNPPFGVNAALANKFINKALEFKPKLVILIVPRETQRLDEKQFRYDLIWEDNKMFAGKSFYLPGSVDGNDKQMEDWNVNPPVLYLWSHPNFTSKHRAIAEKHGHYCGSGEKNGFDENDEKMHISNSEDCHQPDECMKHGDMLSAKSEKQEVKGKVETTRIQESSRRESSSASDDKNHSQKKIESGNHVTESHGKRKREERLDDPVQKGKSPRNESKLRGAGNSRGGRYSSPRKSSQVHSRRNEPPPQQQNDRRNFSSRHQNPRGNQDEVVDDVLMRYVSNTNNEVPSAHYYAPEVVNNRERNSYGWESNLQSHHGMEEQSPWSQRHVQDVYPTYGPPPPPPPSYSARPYPEMQQYAPVQHQQGPDEYYHRTPGFQSGSLSFAPSPYRAFHPQNSSGWLND